MVSKTEIEGRKIIDRTLGRDQDHGGVLAEITGAQGTSKTSTLLAFTNFTQIRHPEEKIFWREQTRAPLQIFKLGVGKYEFLVKKGSEVVFRDRNNKLQIVDDREDLPIRYFDTYEDAYNMATPGKASVVFFHDHYEWMDFIDYLREAGEWLNVFLDEMADIAPADCSGDLYGRIRDFSGTMGSVRRCMMNVFYNTQTVADVNWRIRKKVMLKVFLPGAKADRRSRITQRAIDALDRNPVLGNEAYLDYGGEFGKIRFTDIYKPDHSRHIEATRKSTITTLNEA